MDYLKALEILNTILAELGNVSVEEAVTWLQTKANAENLRREGHPPQEDAAVPAEKP